MRKYDSTAARVIVRRGILTGEISQFIIPIDFQHDSRLRCSMLTSEGWMLCSDFGRIKTQGERRRTEFVVPGQSIFQPGQCMRIITNDDGLIERGSLNDGDAFHQHLVKITSVRLRRLQETSDTDAMRAGVFEVTKLDYFRDSDAHLRYRNPLQAEAYPTPRQAYEGWISLRKPRLWANNPWTWAISFSAEMLADRYATS